MRISKKFKLGVTQYELDFVDVDTSKDLRLFLDPHFLGQRSDRWSIAASGSIQSFFKHFLALLKAGKRAEARELFSHLGEPNDTCLGMSRGIPKGSGVGAGLADEMFESLADSEAVKSGVLTDLEDARIFVKGVDNDRVSDMTTALIRQHLLEYTIAQCDLWGMPLNDDVPSGGVWDESTNRWTNYLTRRLVIAGRPILLVPKAIVSFSKAYTAKKYHQHFVLTYLKHEHLRLDTVLVQRRKRKDGSVRRWVTKKSIVEHESPGDKAYLAAFTERHVEVFADFKDRAAGNERSLPNKDFTDAKLEEVVTHVRAALDAVTVGGDDATRYHRIVAGILELCFYPALVTPKIETPLHDGRKRVDITFDNAADEGFFHRLHAIHHIPCAYVMTECKNYSRDVKNPELDQLAGRFGTNRGQFGLLVSRTADNMETLILRCADAYKDGRGLMIPLTDSDLHDMMEAKLNGSAAPYEDILSDRLRRIAMN